MIEQKIVEIGMVDGKVSMKVDPNKDGQEVLKLTLDPSEAVQEAFKRQGEVKGVKLVSFKLKGSKLILKLDTDKDGESVLDLEIDFMEAIDEVT